MPASDHKAAAARKLTAAEVALPVFTPAADSDSTVFDFTSHRRAREALEFALGIEDLGYNDFVLGEERSGRMTATLRYLEQAMQQLVRAGILKGVRGPRGGYTLARERRRITVADVVRVIAADEESDEDTGSDIGAKVIRPLWSEIQEEIISRLETVTLEDLCRRAQEAALILAALGTPFSPQARGEFSAFSLPPAKAPAAMIAKNGAIRAIRSKAKPSWN